MQYTIPVEYAHERKMRTRNKVVYRLAHWPIWIWVFFLAPGPLTFSLFAHGFSRGNFLWLCFVMVSTGIAGLFGQLPGVEPQPYILRFCEDKPNPLYRRVCYTFAWNAVLNFAAMNLAGLVGAVITRKWYLQQIYQYAYLPMLLLILLLGAFGRLPRAGTSTKGEGWERRYFYAAVWSITIGQAVLLVLWKAFPRSHVGDVVKLCVFIIVLTIMGMASGLGRLPRTRPILPGELMVAD